MCREGRRHPAGKTQSTSRKKSSFLLNSPCQETQDNACCCSSLALRQPLFLFHFPSPSVPPYSWSVLASVLPLADQDGLSLPAHLGHCPQIGSSHQMEVLSSVLVRLSEARCKPGIPEMSMNQERRKHSSLMKT